MFPLLLILLTTHLTLQAVALNVFLLPRNEDYVPARGPKAAQILNGLACYNHDEKTCCYDPRFVTFQHGLVTDLSKGAFAALYATETPYLQQSLSGCRNPNSLPQYGWGPGTLEANAATIEYAITGGTWLYRPEDEQQVAKDAAPASEMALLLLQTFLSMPQAIRQPPSPPSPPPPPPNPRHPHISNGQLDRIFPNIYPSNGPSRTPHSSPAGGVGERVPPKVFVDGIAYTSTAEADADAADAEPVYEDALGNALDVDRAARYFVQLRLGIAPQSQSQQRFRYPSRVP